MTALLPLLSRYWQYGAMALLALALGVQSWRLDREQAAHEATEAAGELLVANYRGAAEQARADAERARAEAAIEQQRISDEVATDYQQRLADLRARYDRMRRQVAANPGSPGTGDMPGLSCPAGGIDARALNSGFLEILAAADENTERLIALQEWVRGQADR
ncbi:MAG: hypothetical protein WCZ66_09310 [Sphingomonadaceae bacterium]